MRIVEADPENWLRRVRQAAPGTTIQLAAGRYKGGEIVGLRGRPDAPIAIVGAPELELCIDSPGGSRFDGGVAFDAFRRRVERESDKLIAAGKYPGVYTLAGEATLRLRDCEHVEIRDLHFENCWPTAVHLDQCRDIAFDRIMTRGSSYAFYAIGREAPPARTGTRRLRFRRCHWLQDDTPERRLWNTVAWDQVHGVGPGTGGERLYDGSFFNAYDIPGGVEFDSCVVEHAFNGIHFFNEDLAGDRSRDVHIHHCEFRFIRDNPVEPEDRVRNWWIHHNRFVDCHKWFSLELFRAGHVYIFANTGWTASTPGATADAGRSGAVFKLLAYEDDIGRYDGPVHVFNNSWCLRSHLFKDGALARLRHHNNAVAFQQYLAGASGGTGKPFGKHKEPRGAGAAPFFTKEWRKLDIAFTNDLVQHGSWPAELRHCGYHRLDGVHGAPMFADPLNGGFELLPDSPCRDAGVRIPVELPGGAVWTPPDHVPFNIGAAQDEEVFKDLTFRPLPDGGAWS